jgi:phosphatidylserine/phosphatidylglycerophosphate/cardiolipin synthase-like enzyme
VLFLLTFLFSVVAFPTEVYFSPSPDCENRIVKAIQESKGSIVAAVYSINNRKIVNELITAKKRGVEVKILTDRVQASQKNSGLNPLLENGVDVRVHSKFRIEHNKFGIYDGKTVSTGSFNWTGPAARSNSENCLFTDEAPIVAKYKERFDFLWEKNTADGSKAHIAKIQSKRKLRKTFE